MHVCVYPTHQSRASRGRRRETASCINISARLTSRRRRCRGRCRRVAAIGRVGSAASRRRVKAGGTYKVGWEPAFGFTDAFDPTGEYLGAAFGIYSNLLVRTLVGYNHVAGAAGQRDRPRHRDRGPEADERREDLHVPPEEGIKFGPPVNRAGHLAPTSCTRWSGSPTRRTAASTRSTTP